MEDKRRRKLTRAETIENISISLSSTNPFERLKEFTAQGKYRYSFHWDKFANGVMIECKIYYFLKRKMRTLVKETAWVNTSDLGEAKMVISAILLQNLGLGFEEPPEELTGEKIAEFGMKAVSGLLSHVTEGSWADQVDDDY